MRTSMNRRLFIKFIGIFSMVACTGAIYSCKSHEKPSAFRSGLIDVHHHILPPDCVVALKRNGMTSAGGVAFPDWSTQTSLNVMNQNEIAGALPGHPVHRFTCRRNRALSLMEDLLVSA